MARPKKTGTEPKDAKTYRHPTADLPARPEIGTQAHFKKTKAPTTYRFDSSLSPALDWDGRNPARETAEALIGELADAGRRAAELAAQPVSAKRDRALDELKSRIAAARRRLAGLSGPFLNWAGKAERLSFEVPTLPLFVHERLSTKAILETLKGHKRDRQEDFFDLLFAAGERSLADQVLRAYEHRDEWVNRLILGDSLVVMNSLLRYESLGGQVQMIYIDPPYGVKFGSNFQPFIRKRDVKHNEDDDFTREPEMVQAYRDTWELGLHSYLTYMRDRLLLARELLAPSGSVFVQISDENLHHVRELMDEVFGAENFCGVITVKKTTGAGSPAIGTEVVPAVCDYLLWYARNRESVKYRQLYLSRGGEGWVNYDYVKLKDGTYRRMTLEEREDWSLLPEGALVYRRDNLTSTSAGTEASLPIQHEGKTYSPGRGGWKTSRDGLQRLSASGRLEAYGNTLAYRRYASDFPYSRLSNLWDDTVTGGYAESRYYVVQTNSKVVLRALLMTTDPGDLVLDPTCGSGTTAHVAEQWGRRWITIDTSRVPLALARQRLLTGTFDYYELKDEARGPAAGFTYKRKQNAKGEEVGGIVPHVTLKSIANNEPPAEEVLVDRPEILRGIVRVTGPFTFEATIPTAEGLDEEPETPGIQSENYRSHVERMIEVLRLAPVLRLPGNRTVTLKQVRPPAKALALSAEALVDKPSLANLADDASKQPALARETEPVAILFGPENGPISERLVREAWDEAGLKHYTQLFVIGFGIDPKAREFVEKAKQIGIPCTYLQATMDLQMGDLLKNMRSSQVFSVCGLPDVAVRPHPNPLPGGEGIRQKLPSPSPGKRANAYPSPRAAGRGQGEGARDERWEVELRGLDTFDPTTMEPDHLAGGDVPAWFLDTDYNGLVFRVRQAFFPRTGAWENLKKALRYEFEDTVWDHLSGTTSAPFLAGDHRQIAVKVIDPRGNELTVVKKLEPL